MTKKDLEKAGIVHLGSKIYPNRFYVPVLGEMDVSENYNWDDIYQKVYNKCFLDGTRYGEAKKATEIKDALGIKNN